MTVNEWCCLLSIDDTRKSTDNSFNVTLVNQLLRLDDVTVTLQWLQEPGAIYRFNVLPDASHTELTRIMSLDSITVNLTLFRNIQYNVSIVSSLCGVTSSKILHYGKCKRSMIIDTTKVLIDYTHIIIIPCIDNYP